MTNCILKDFFSFTCIIEMFMYITECQEDRDLQSRLKVHFSKCLRTFWFTSCMHSLISAKLVTKRSVHKSSRGGRLAKKSAKYLKIVPMGYETFWFTSCMHSLISAKLVTKRSVHKSSRGGRLAKKSAKYLKIVPMGYERLENVSISQG